MAAREKSSLTGLAGGERRPETESAELFVGDLAAAAEYYVTKLGFEWFEQSHTSVQLALEGTRLTLKQAGKLGVQRSAVNLFCTDAVFLHDRLRTRGVEMREQLTSKPFGLHNFCALDPDGNELHFSNRPALSRRNRPLAAYPAHNLGRTDFPFDEPTIQQTAQRSHDALQEYAILDSLVPAAFHALTELAATNFGTDMSMITLIDRDRQWFASHYGCAKSEMPLARSICAHVATARFPIVIENAKQDKKWRNHPAVTEDLEFRFYAGVPLFTRDRVAIGAMCVADRKPHHFSPVRQQALNSFAVIANFMMENMRLYAKIDKCCP